MSSVPHLLVIWITMMASPPSPLSGLNGLCIDSETRSHFSRTGNCEPQISPLVSVVAVSCSCNVGQYKWIFGWKMAHARIYGSESMRNHHNSCVD
ncbi:hypothetical protein C8J55DRAFT_293788 [Lentinula edodes]|uniref:Secreted protein n=1 Tax=Lentinula lateritia TaxID=40482 RepID=A0A9W8ZQS9_9AGAR|nr:hypothetical protein C8J55DRAFT_293788 [Lentinula edodes]